MLPHARFAILFFVVLGSAACTTLTPEQRSAACQATDWHNFGVNDGILGVPTAERTEKFSDCAALGYPANLAVYQAARSEGLQTYCTVEIGYETGYAGRRYRNVCPPELEQNFLQGYDQGRKERPARSYYPYYGFGFGYYGYPYLGYRFGYRRHRHRRHHRHRGGGK